MKIRKYRLETSFVLPLTDVRQANGLLTEIQRRIKQIIGPDIKVNATCRRMYRVFGPKEKKWVDKT